MSCLGSVREKPAQVPTLALAVVSCDQPTAQKFRNPEQTPSYFQRMSRRCLNLCPFFFPDVTSRARFHAPCQSAWKYHDLSETPDHAATSKCPKDGTRHLPCQRPDDATCAYRRT